MRAVAAPAAGPHRPGVATSTSTRLPACSPCVCTSTAASLFNGPLPETAATSKSTAQHSGWKTAATCVASQLSEPDPCELRGACLLHQVVRGQHDESAQPPDNPAAQRSNNWQGVRQGFAAACRCVDAQVVCAAVQRPPHCRLHWEKAVDAASLERRSQPSVEGDAGGVKLNVALAVQRVSVSHPGQRGGRMALCRRRRGCRRRRRGRSVGHSSAVVVASAVVAVAFISKRCVCRGRLRAPFPGNHVRKQVSRWQTATPPGRVGFLASWG